MGEGAAAVAVAERPDRGDARPQHFVGDDKAVAVDLDASCFEAKVVGIRAAADGEKNVRTGDLARPGRSVDRKAYAGCRLFGASTLRLERNRDVLALENVLDCIAHVLVLARHEARRRLYHRHLAPEPPKHLRKLQADVASSEHD